MTQLQKKETTIVDAVQQRVTQLEKLGELTLPKDYNAANAIRAAWLDLEELTVDKGGKKELVVNVATRASLMKSLFKMVVMGLSVAKGQGSFILYGNKLTFQPMYHGNILLAKRWAGVKKVNHHTIYEGDEVEIFIDEEGNKKVVHRPKFENINLGKIKGAYCVVIFEDGTRKDEVLTKDQITKSWLQGPMKGQSPAHKNFPDAMSEKSVANRILTQLYKQSNDGAILEKIENAETEDQMEKVSASESSNSESKSISFDMYEDVSDYEEKPKREPEPTPEPEKKESKAKPPKKEEKPVEQPEMDFDDEQDEPF